MQKPVRSLAALFGFGGILASAGHLIRNIND